MVSIEGAVSIAVTSMVGATELAQFSGRNSRSGRNSSGRSNGGKSSRRSSRDSSSHGYRFLSTLY